MKENKKCATDMHSQWSSSRLRTKCPTALNKIEPQAVQWPLPMILTPDVSAFLADLKSKDKTKHRQTHNQPLKLWYFAS